MKEKIAQFAKLVEEQQIQRLKDQGFTLERHLSNIRTKVIPDGSFSRWMLETAADTWLNCQPVTFSESRVTARFTLDISTAPLTRLPNGIGATTILNESQTLSLIKGLAPLFRN